LVDFTKEVLAQKRVRLIGVCFGHQIIGRAMGVKVDRSDRGWEVSVSPVQLTEKGKELFGVEELVRSPLSRRTDITRSKSCADHRLATTGNSPNAPRHRLRLALVRRAPGLFAALRGSGHV